MLESGEYVKVLSVPRAERCRWQSAIRFTGAESRTIIKLMSIFQRLRSNLRDDPLLQRVLRNSSYLFSSSAISAVMALRRSILWFRLLSPEEYGLVFAIVMVFVSGVNRLLLSDERSGGQIRW